MLCDATRISWARLPSPLCAAVFGVAATRSTAITYILLALKIIIVSLEILMTNIALGRFTVPHAAKS